MFVSLFTKDAHTINTGDLVSLRVDFRTGEVAAFKFGQGFIGFADGIRYAAEGCMPAEEISMRLVDNVALSTVAVIIGDRIILHTESPYLEQRTYYSREVFGSGYGVLKEHSSY